MRVDDWLRTGLNADGSESPSKRDLFRTTNAVWAALKYSEEHPASVWFTPLSPDPYVLLGEPHRVSYKWSDLFVEAVKEADRLFTSLMASGWRESVAKCRHAACGRYFLLKKSRQSHRRGTFCCPEHRNVASAAACKRERRAQTENELIDLAAKQLLKWRIDSPDWYEDANRKRRLAAELSLAIGRSPVQSYRQKVESNWVTRHRLEIERKRAQAAEKLEK